MSVATMHVVTDDLREQAWKLYREAFDPLRHTAVQRHVMYDDEFDAVMADARVDKYLIYDDEGTLQGLGTITNMIESMPLVSPEYFATRWPERFAAGPGLLHRLRRGASQRPRERHLRRAREGDDKHGGGV